MEYTSPVLRHISTKALLALVVGKTHMTATGRASLIVGGLTAASFLYNESLNRDLTREQMAVHERLETQKLEIERKKLDLETQKWEASQKRWWSRS